MKWNKSVNSALASSIVALSLTGQIEAGMNSEHKPKDSFAFAFPKDVNLVDPNDIYFYVAGLAMQASEGGLEYGIQNDNGSVTNGSGGSAIPLKHGYVLNFDWNYNPGVRVGLGGYIDHDAWNLEGNWTWVHFSNYTSNETPATSIVIPLWMTGGDSAPASFGNGANAGWRGQYNQVDLWMGKPYHISRHFVMNPVLGMRFGFIDQTFRVDYGGLNFRSKVYTTNNFYGFGLRAGVNSEWIVNKDWRFFGTAAGSMLRSHIHAKERFSVPSGTNSPTTSYIDETIWDNIPVLDLSLGLQWGMFFNCERNYVAVRAAYEFQEWFDLFYVRKIYNGGFANSNGFGNEALRTDFSLNGFSLAVQFDF
ncbi:MAG: hypothetical protein HY069_03085 [Chlamydiia bacterium]|nr:hypothetical protein [Chlamydiia bacterium]